MRPGRVVGVDVARCVALVAMMATHVLPVHAADGGLAWSHAVAGGRASALFAVLAGVSVALMSGGTTPLHGAERSRVTRALAVRALLVLLVGLALGGLPTTIAVILSSYGVLFLLGLPFLGLRARALAVLAGCWVVLAPVLSHAVRPQLPARGFDSPLLADLAHPVQLLSELTFTGYYPAVPWLGYLLVGMAVGRADLRRGRTAAVLAGTGAALAATAWTVSELLLGRADLTAALLATAPFPGMSVDELRLWLAEGVHGTTPTGSWAWLAVHAPHSGTPFDLAHTSGTALLVLGTCLAVGRLLPRAATVVFGAGAMTLTLYTLHVVLRTPAFLPGEDGTTYLWHVAIVLATGATFALLAWPGPLERSVALLSGTHRRAGRAVSRRAGGARPGRER